jgi:hypothetical protein
MTSTSMDKVGVPPVGSAIKQETASLSQEGSSNEKDPENTISTTGKSSNSSSDTPGGCSISRTVMLRFLLTFSLLLATAVCTAVSFGVLKEAEEEVGRQTYESIAVSGLAGAQAIAKRKIQGSQVMATLLAQVFPDVEDWPLIAMEGYAPIAQRVADLTTSGTQSLMVLLDFDRPNTPSIAQFEQHTQHRPVNRESPKGES